MVRIFDLMLTNCLCYTVEGLFCTLFLQGPFLLVRKSKKGMQKRVQHCMSNCMKRIGNFTSSKCHPRSPSGSGIGSSSESRRLRPYHESETNGISISVIAVQAYVPWATWKFILCYLQTKGIIFQDLLTNLGKTRSIVTSRCGPSLFYHNGVVTVCNRINFVAAVGRR